MSLARQGTAQLLVNMGSCVRCARKDVLAIVRCVIFWEVAVEAPSVPA